ncbi:unnamed protein product [Boreogadus saida]
MMLRLQRYNLNVIYKRGRELYVADALSRAHLPSTDQAEEMEEDEVMVVDVLSSHRVEELKTDEDQLESAPCPCHVSGGVLATPPQPKSYQVKAGDATYSMSGTDATYARHLRPMFLTPRQGTHLLLLQSHIHEAHNMTVWDRNCHRESGL